MRPLRQMRSVSYLLTLLMTLSMMPLTGHSHRHAGGAEPHEHHEHHGLSARPRIELRAEAGHHHEPEHGHAHGPSVDPCSHEHDEPAAERPEVAHLHLLFFGLPLALPHSQDSTEQTTASWAAWLLGDFVIGSSRPMTCDSVDNSLAVLNLTLIRPQLDWALIPQQIERSGAPLATRWLCDTARHERSGVQLI